VCVCVCVCVCVFVHACVRVCVLGAGSDNTGNLSVKMFRMTVSVGKKDTRVAYRMNWVLTTHVDQ